jgi:GNAT superfamily N-acetyltransferase
VAHAGLSIVTEIIIRPATRAEIPLLETLITASARTLSRGHYDETEIEAAVAHVFGVDSDLVDDGTYLVAEAPDGTIAGCGGWSQRRTLFGGNQASGRDSSALDPATDAARIRAFFTAPGWERQGIASRLLAACEDAARPALLRGPRIHRRRPGGSPLRRHDGALRPDGQGFVAEMIH